MKLVPLLLIFFTLLHISSSNPTSSTPPSSEDVCSKLACSKDEVCDWEAAECVNRNDMTEGRPCGDHDDCRHDHICYGGRCILFHGRH